MSDQTRDALTDMLAEALHNHAISERIAGGRDREGIDWMKWERLPEWAQEVYIKKSQFLVDAFLGSDVFTAHVRNEQTRALRGSADGFEKAGRSGGSLPLTTVAQILRSAAHQIEQDEK